MRATMELRLFHGAVGVLLLIPIAVGVFGGLGGLEGLARVLVADAHVVAGPSLRNHLRAVCWGFFVIAPMVLWTLRSLVERASGFRLAVGCASLAGFTRITGWVVDGYPGTIPVTLLLMELGVLPMLLLWHARLVRLARS